MVHYSACQDAIWGLDSLGQIFIRTLSSSCPTGMHWTKLDLSQLGMTFLLSRLSVNSQQTVCIFIQKCLWFTDLKYNVYWSKQYLIIMGIAAEDCKTRALTAFRQCFTYPFAGDSMFTVCKMLYMHLCFLQFVSLRPRDLTQCCADVPVALTSPVLVL